MRLCSAVACCVSVAVVLLGHKVELHFGVVHAVWNVLLGVGSVLPVDVCGTFALYTQFFFVLDSTWVLKISLCHINMMICHRRRWSFVGSVGSCVSLAAVLTAGDRGACLKAGPGDTGRPV